MPESPDQADARLFAAGLIPDVEVTFIVDGLTLTHQDREQVIGVVDVWLTANGRTILTRDIKWDADQRECWLVPVPVGIVERAIENGVYDEHVRWYTPTGEVGVDIHIEWDPRGADFDEVLAMYR